MTSPTYTTAMQARIEHDALDSVAPIDFDVERGDEWKLPPVKAWAPKPAWRERLHVWLGGEPK